MTVADTCQRPLGESEHAALAIYAVMARDVSDALDLILECSDRSALEILLAMLRHPGGAGTDRTLNALLVDPVERRVRQLEVDSPVLPVITATLPVPRLTATIYSPDPSSPPMTLGDVVVDGYVPPPGTARASDSRRERVHRCSRCVTAGIDGSGHNSRSPRCPSRARSA